MRVRDAGDQFTEDRVAASEPRSSVFRGILGVEGFMHEPCASGSINEHSQTGLDLILIMTGQGAHDD